MSAARLRMTVTHAPSRTSLYDRKVAREDRLHRQLSEPRPGEYRLDNHRPGKQIRDLKPRNRDHRNGRVSGHVTEQNSLGRHAARPCGADVVSREFLNDGVPRHPREIRETE